LGIGFFGSSFIIDVVWLLRNITFDNYISLVFFFAGLSFIGVASMYMTFIDVVGRRMGRHGNRIIWLIFMLPGLHFWTSAIGKDSLTVLAFAMMLQILRKRSGLDWIIFSSGVGLCFMSRPHVGVAIMFSALTFYGFYYSGNGIAWKRYLVRLAMLIMLIGVTVAGYYFLLDSVQKYSSEGFSDIGEFIQSRQDVYADTSSGVDLSSYPIWAKFIVFLLGALPTGINGMLQLGALLEGLVIVGMMLYVLVRLKASWFRSRDQRLVSIFFFFVFLVVTFILSLVAGNQGLAVRQRVMAYIPLAASFIFSLWAVAEAKARRKVSYVGPN
jgi:hypothetical protein